VPVFSLKKVVDDERHPRWEVQDVCAILDMHDVSKAVARLKIGEKRMSESRNVLIMNESGVYRLLSRVRRLGLGLLALICCGAVNVGLLSCTSKSPSVASIILSWDYEGPMPAAFQIDRSLDAGHTWIVYQEGVAPTARTFTDTAPTGAFPGYRVLAVAPPPMHSSPPSPFACIAGPGAPPTSLRLPHFIPTFVSPAAK